MKKVRKITLTQIEDRKGEKTEIIKLAEKVAQQVSIRNSTIAPTKQVETAH